MGERHIENEEILNLLIKRVFGSLLLSPGKWPLVEENGFSIGRTYFYDRIKKRPAIHRAAADKIEEIYQYALTEGSGCDYDPLQISRKLCEVLEEYLLRMHGRRFLVTICWGTCSVWKVAQRKRWRSF